MRRFFGLLLLFIAYCTATLSATDDGLTDLVQWDQYSLIVNGQRLYVFSGEFHYQRLPVPELWLDIFQKFRANGLNAVSIYFFWSYHSASRGVYDFTTSGKDVQKLLDYAKQAGLYVIARPGPYCNAETNGGGLALHLSDGSGGKLRTSDQTYYDSWLPWMQGIGAILAKNQITNGGNVIIAQVENELQETSHVANNTLVLYMEQIEKAYRDAAVVVPLSHNEKGMRSVSWSTDYQNVGGAVNIYGLDNYPGGLSCTDPDSGFNVLRTYYQWFQNYSYTQPKFLPEFEGGWFSPWGPDSTFYDSCATEHDPAFADVFYKNNIGQGIVMQNLYMAYGGTNWGHSAAPVVYTSYDYSAPLRETREVWRKFSQTKLIALFTRVSKGLLKTQMVGNGTGYATNSSSVFTWYTRNVDSGAGFYTVQQNSTPSRSTVYFTVTLQTSSGNVTVPNVSLYGRQSKIICTDYTVGNKTLLYSTADILTYGLFDITVLVLYMPAGQTGEFAFKSGTNVGYSVYGDDSSITAGWRKADQNSSSASFPTYTWKQPTGHTVVKFSSGLTVYMLSQETAWKFFAPPTTSNPDVAPDQHMFVIGPYLVRDAHIDGNTVYVSGDNTNDTTIEVYTGKSDVSTINWNGQDLSTSSTPYGALTAELTGVANRTIEFPALTGWKVADSLPESQREYEDSKWTVCNKTSTRSPVKPITYPVLFSSDYGFYTGIKIYRGYFDGKSATSANITASGGLGFGWSAWLNGQLVGGYVGNGSITTNSQLLTFSNATLFDTNNVLTVVVDYHGHDETSTGSGVENPRGLLGAQLFGSSTNSTNTNLTFTQWKITGNAGGSSNIDPVRGPMNEGGLCGERLGWHLPGFDTSGWESGSPLENGPSKAGVNFYVTAFDLDIDNDLDVPLGISFSAPNGTVARIQLFINGYQYGKYVPHLGPQTVFPVPPGIINNRGRNTIALSLWAMTDAGAKLSNVELVKYGVYESSFGFSQDWSYLQPGWSSHRLQYG